LKRRIAGLLPVLCALCCLAAAPPEGVKISFRRDAVLSLLSAAMPYKIEVGTGMLKESLVFTEPRNLVFSPERVTFAVRCQGSPFPVDQVLNPVLVFQQSSGGYKLVVQSLPVAIPGFGKVDIKDFFEPVDLRSLMRQSVIVSGKPTLLEVRVDKVAVAREAIDFSATLLLTPAASR
jgi:hypothetical protein